MKRTEHEKLSLLLVTEHSLIERMLSIEQKKQRLDLKQAMVNNIHRFLSITQITFA